GSRIVFIAANTLIGLVAIIGNTLLLASVNKTRALQTISNAFVCSLALADLLVGLIAAPLNILRVESTHNAFNKAFDLSVIHSLVAATFSLTAVSCDRFIAISRPLRYPSLMTPKVTTKVLALIWFTATIEAIPSVFLYGRALMVYWVTHVILTVILPACVVIVCYVKIFKIAKRHSRDERVRPSVAVVDATFSVNYHNSNAAKTFAIIIAIFVVSFLPNLVCNLMDAALYAARDGMLPEYFFWSNCVMFLSSAINPMIYGARNKEFRSAFKRLCLI
ncbi:predicted protein, partial [Nematostella vectensis]